MATVADLDAAGDLIPVELPEFHEIIDGCLVETTPLGAAEHVLALELVRSINLWEGSDRHGRIVSEVLFTLSPKRRRRPDVAYVSTERWPIGKRIPQGNPWNVVPDLAIEIVSPTDVANDLMTKVGDYLEAGVRAVWIVYPIHRLIHVYENASLIRGFTDGDLLDAGSIIPGFRLDLTRWFDEVETGSENEQPET